jgi:hypothetical protein
MGPVQTKPTSQGRHVRNQKAGEGDAYAPLPAEKDSHFASPVPVSASTMIRW